MLAKNPERRPAARDVEQQLVAMQRSDTVVDQASLTASARRTTVGRETQRVQLRRVYAGVRERRGLIVAVTGEPGIGKTSLIEDFLSEVASSGAAPTIARGRCSERLAGAEAYLPVLEALDSLLHRRDRPLIDETMKTFAPTWYLEVAKRTFEEVSLAQLRERTPLGSQERMKRELSALLEELSRVRPLVLFVDDLQWADVSTIDMLNYLAVRLSDMRVLVLASYRPSDMALSQHPFLGVRRDLHARGLFEEIPLPFLEVGDIERYLALQFPSHHFSPGFASMIHAKTEGSPLFMADLVRYLRNTGGIVEETGRWVLANALADVPRGLPESVRSMIERKIEQVDEHDRRLLADGQRAGTSVRFDDRRRSGGYRSRRGGRASREARACACVREARRRAGVSGSNTHADLPVRARALSEHALRLAPAHQAQSPQRPRRRSAPAPLRRPLVDHRGTACRSARRRARFCGKRRVFRRCRAALRRPVCVPRGRVAVGPRSRSTSLAARWSVAKTTRAQACDDQRSRAQIDQRLGDARG